MIHVTLPMNWVRQRCCIDVGERPSEDSRTRHHDGARVLEPSGKISAEHERRDLDERVGDVQKSSLKLGETKS
jgi:hypothetical protein